MSLFKRKLIISSLLLLSFNAFSAGDDINEIAPEADVADAKEITGDIRFTGKITDSSCDITQKDKDVYLGEHSVAKLKKNDDRTEEKAFDISLINCSLAMKSLKIKMEGAAHADNATLYALDANDKSAGKVGISIMTAEGQQVTPAGGYRDIPLKADSRDYTLNYTAAYQATGLATSGEGNATVNYTVSYE